MPITREERTKHITEAIEACEYLKDFKITETAHNSIVLSGKNTIFNILYGFQEHALEYYAMFSRADDKPCIIETDYGIINPYFEEMRSDKPPILALKIWDAINTALKAAKSYETSMILGYDATKNDEEDL